MEEAKKIFKQRLRRIHVAVGINVSLLLYVSVFFGIFAILLPFIQVWEKPSRHYAMPNIENVDYSAMIDSVLGDPDYPQINGITINLPGSMHDPALRISTMFMKTKVFNPNTTQEVENEDEQSQLAMFLNGMHYGRPFKLFGYIVFGLMAVATMFLLIGGLMLIWKVSYKNSGKNAQSRFSKWHRKIFTWVFPPFIIITLTGALMNIGYTTSAPMTFLASKGETFNTWKLVGPILYPSLERIEKKHDRVSMLSMNEILEHAKAAMPEVSIQKITLSNWKDSRAQAKVEGYNPYMPFLNGISNLPSVTLSGVDGRVLHQHKVMDKHWSGLFYEAMFFLHFLFGVDIFTRLLMAILMVFAGGALGFGVLLYMEKEARKFPQNIPVYHWFGKLSLAVMVGVFPATGLLFALQWSLPFELSDRFLWQKGAFALMWLATLTWAFYRLSSYQAAKEFLKLGGILFLIAPLMHFYNSGFSPLRLWNEGMISILSVDCGLFVLGSILLLIGFKLPQERAKVMAFWTQKF
ncbi:PepSY-associated TM helix domain-containing protein [Sulfurospirillum barnesii]|uniref:Iron-regulated membrane protein n=1 Tax=Sulfurospirillum barnesii (strain ATCC 700032 / DSM 10660 / SES-3) TaxID=760154 RepID=I3XZA5_SULBS|nr:PepSY-associated TM helix domain-containing protein [Sulfurospirillum barnesii]AFL69279.1 hypothetical protein Sulba_2000 [Sulfurospirillum barnesii SES-3]